MERFMRKLLGWKKTCHQLLQVACQVLEVDSCIKNVTFVTFETFRLFFLSQHKTYTTFLSLDATDITVFESLGQQHFSYEFASCVVRQQANLYRSQRPSPCGFRSLATDNFLQRALTPARFNRVGKPATATVVRPSGARQCRQHWLQIWECRSTIFVPLA